MEKQRVYIADFGQTNQGKASIIKLSNSEINVTLTNYGGTIISIETPDQFGHRKNIVAGFDTLISYLGNHPYLGCAIGRFANRIAYGKFQLNGQNYQLPINDGINHLHGGNGFDKKLWAIKEIIEENGQSGVQFFYVSKDDEEGYPGNLAVSLKYLLNEQGLHVIFEAQTDQTTVVNLTNHSYFNLSGFEDETIYNHDLQIYADKYLVKNSNNIPSGEMAAVKNTVFDFSSPKKIGKEIQQLPEDRGYDHDFVLNLKSNEMVAAVQLTEPLSKRVLKIYTNNPSVHIYTANWWDGACTGTQKVPYIQHGAIAFETQYFPDSPNQPHFPSVVLQPKQRYQTQTLFNFSTSK